MTENHFTFANESVNFKADSEKRTIEGVILPFGVVGRNSQGKFRFAPGSVDWPKSTISRVKLNREHDRTDLLGAATDIRSNDEGLSGKFKVARGAAGDQALMSAEDAVLDGFSVEVDILEFAPDPEDPSVNVVTSARLTGVALTGSPAFSDARLTSVHASNNPGDNEMTDAPTPAVAPDVSAIADAIREGFSNLPVAAPAAIPSATFTSVSEEKPYRFNGEKGAHEFSGDVFSAIKGDGEAKNRLDAFTAEFAVTTGNVATINPTVDVPSMYVDRLKSATPVADAIRKGGLSDGTPFRFPGFDVSSGLVADHVQGTEPTPGAFSTKSITTVTPAALSGRIDINREVVDAGGNPQVSNLIWGEMQYAYALALETKATAFLSALAGVTSKTITTGATNAVLSAEVEALIGDLHFNVGGLREDTFLTHQNLHSALVAARDGQGRPLYPSVGATNANGTTAANFGSVAVGPFVARPAWSLGAKSAATGNSYLFASADLHLWNSAPRRFDIDIQVASVSIGLFGYVATAASRTSTVSRIGYDPVV